MKKRLSRTLALSAVSLLMGSFLLFSGGCTKKTIFPPDGELGGAGSGMSGGTDINYPPADKGFSGGYDEDSLPVEGTLDDSNGFSGTAGNSPLTMDIDMQSEEYKRAHGRCTANLEPIYFDFDQAGVRSGMTEVLMSNAEKLKTIPGTMVIIEGNSDERGTNEYNLALGERRAINSREYLRNLGIAPERMRTLSYGEERPLFPGQNEEAYGLNRRVDFIVK